MPNILILGGTSEASALAAAFADAGVTAMLSYAGRVANPRPQPVPVRVGGFGGAEGLAHFLKTNGITHLVDATHPFAATMSANACKAANEAGIALVALTRPPWTREPGDDWRDVPDIDEAVAALAGPARRVMLALGRQNLAAFAAQPQHHYLLRLVDQPQTPPPLPRHGIIVDRGPFAVEADRALLHEHAIEIIVSKNAGGDGARAKLVAARELGLPVIMIARPPLPPRRELHSIEAVIDWLRHDADLGV